MGRRSEELKALIKREAEKAKQGVKPMDFSVQKAVERKIKREVVREKVREKANEFPVEDVDYWIHRQEKNVPCAPGHIHRASTRSVITKTVMKQVFENLKAGLVRPKTSTTYWTQTWIVYPGPKPDKKWGPRVP